MSVAVAVVLLPFLGDATVSLKQAEGVTAQVRSAITPEVAKVLTTTPNDQKDSERCQRDPKCLGEIADVRGADLIGTGFVTPTADGLKVQLVVVAPKATTVLRRVEITLQGNDADERRLARLVRQAFNVDALRGALLIRAPEGAVAKVDDVEVAIGVPVPDLREGDHRVVVTGAGGSFVRTVGVVHGDTTEVKAVLVEEALAAPSGSPGEEAGGIGTDVIVVGAIGATLLLAGGVAGTFSLLESIAVEERAARQNLAFPDDSERMQRGTLLAYTADGLYVAGAAALATAAVLFALEAP